MNFTYWVTINDRKFVITDAQKHKDGVVSFRIGDTRYSVSLTPIPKVTLDDYKTDLMIERGSGSICSPITGSVTAINVSEGQRVTKGDILMVVEAMKMENPIITFKSGIVSKLKVKVGSEINKGDLLCLIED